MQTTHLATTASAALQGLGYNWRAAEQYLTDAMRGGYVHSIGPVTRITYRPTTIARPATFIFTHTPSNT